MLGVLKSCLIFLICITLSACKQLCDLNTQAYNINQSVGHQNSNVMMTISEESEAVKPIDIINCPLTPVIYDDVKVPQIYKTNNLRRRTGYATYANGQFIRIKGVVTDNQCTPIGNATVQIWHADSNGIYKNIVGDRYLNDDMMYSTPKERFKQSYDDNNKSSDINFTGSGTTITDNLGRFTFLSVMPGSVHGKKPVVMFRILHKAFNELNTMMYFPEDSNTNSLLNAKKEGEVINNGESEKIYYYILTLDGQNKYLKY
jgi:protocatechuate 3,4-dioxygenase beta subunit